MRDGDAHTREHPASELNRSSLWNPKLILMPRCIVSNGQTAAARRQALPRVNPVVKRHHRVLKFLISFVSLACDQNTVPRLSQADDLVDGPAAVQLYLVPVDAHLPVAL